MAEELVVYTNPMSRGRIAHWMLEEVGAPYRTEVLELRHLDEVAGLSRHQPHGQGAGDPSRAKRSSPRVPRSAPIWPTPFRPPASPALAERGAIYRWLFFAAGRWRPLPWAKMTGFVPTAEQERVAGFGSYRAVMDTQETARPGGRLYRGDRFTAADVYLGSQIGWGHALRHARGAPRLRRLLGQDQRSRRLPRVNPD
jgi:glutathione S-transferase